MFKMASYASILEFIHQKGKQWLSGIMWPLKSQICVQQEQQIVFRNWSQLVCQCIAQTSLAHWAQPNILYLQFTPFACTAHIPSLYKALYCTLLFTHQYTDYSVFLSHFILLTWYQSHSSDSLVPVDIFGVLPLPSLSSSSHCQKRAIAVTPTVPTTLGYQRSAHSTAKEKAQEDRTANPEQNPTKNGQKLHHTHRHAPVEVPASRARAPRTATRRQYLGDPTDRCFITGFCFHSFRIQCKAHTLGW